MSAQIEPTYLGDGVYARFDGFQVWIWCDGDANEIALEPATMMNLMDFVKAIKERNKGPMIPGVEYEPEKY